MEEVHIKELKYKCPYCEKLFVSHRRMKRHELGFHINPRINGYPCKICGKEFKVGIERITLKLVKSSSQLMFAGQEQPEAALVHAHK